MNQPELRLPSVSSAPESGGADAGRLFRILWRGKWLLIALPVLSFLATRWWLDRQVRIYQAVAQVQVDARQVNVLKSGAGEAIDKPRTVLKQQQGLLRSTTILKRIAESPEIQGLRTFSEAQLKGKTLVGALYECLGTSIDVESNRLFITCRSPFRADAIVVVDEALRVYIDYNRQKQRERAEGLADIVRTEWTAAKRELDEASAAIARLQSEHTLLAGTEQTPLKTKLDDAYAALSAARKEMQQARALHEDMRAAAEDPQRLLERGHYWRAQKPITTLEERIDSLRKDREEREEDLKRWQRTLGPEHETLAELRGEIADLRAWEEQVVLEYAHVYLRNLQVEYEQARTFEANLEEDVRDLLAQVADQNAVLDRIADLKVEREHLRERVAGFDERMAQLELENQTGALNLDVLEPARAGITPIYPDVEKTTLYGTAGGGAAAFLLVLLWGLSDRRVRKVEDLPQMLGTSVLGVVPRVPDSWDRARVARMVEEVPDSPGAEAFRSARTATAFALPQGRGVVLVTSAGRGEGKSVCASNLAFALAKTGRKTLLLDANLRAPVQHRIYGVEDALGLTALLTTSVATRKAIVPRVAIGLDLLPAGDAGGKAAELCEGRILPELVTSLRDTYECIVIDSPPVLESSEARVLASLADAVVLVMRLEVSKAPALERAMGILRGVGARVLGCIPNGASSTREVDAFRGGISYASGPVAGAEERAEREPDGDQGAARKDAGRGTDFLGLEEEAG